jgi:Icc-related predicted phosphoesterase
MKIFCFSDTHGAHAGIKVPECDMMIFCGDMSNDFNIHKNHHECLSFLEWYNGQSPPHKLFIAGNHDVSMANRDFIDISQYSALTYLNHQVKSVGGLSIFGSPYTPRFGPWPFMYKRNIGQNVWSDIPSGIDILITHGPPKGILDLSLDFGDNSIQQVGCKSLYNKVAEVKPILHCFGHIHQQGTFNNYGVFKQDQTTFINCATTDHSGNLTGNGFTFECRPMV